MERSRSDRSVERRSPINRGLSNKHKSSDVLEKDSKAVNIKLARRAVYIQNNIGESAVVRRAETGVESVAGT